MRKATMKIRSRRGASITFALLLFLVCAMASAVAIVSATAAGGRFAQIAETDQRYFAVNSAVELLKDALDGQTVQIKVKEEETVTITRKSTGDERSDPFNKSQEKTVTDCGKTMTGDTRRTILGSIAEARYNAKTDPSAKPAKQILTLEAGDTGVKVFAKREVEDDGTIKIYVKQFQDNGITPTVDNFNDNPGYALTMVFMLEETVNTDRHVEEGSPYNITKNATSGEIESYKVDETTTITTTTNDKWSLTSIRKGAV